MISCIEVALKPELLDAEASSLKKRAFNYFGIKVSDARCVNLLTIESEFSQNELEDIKDKIFTNPVTQISSYKYITL